MKRVIFSSLIQQTGNRLQSNNMYHSQAAIALRPPFPGQNIKTEFRHFTAEPFPLPQI